MDSSWFAVLDIYCERTSAAFWSEPVNALTNLAFFAAAAGGFLHWRRAGRRDWPLLILTGIVVLIGIGSFLFHTFATRITAIADTAPIAIFIYGYLLLALTRFLRLPWWAALATLVGFAVFSAALPLIAPVGLRHGSLSYLPAFCALIVIGCLVTDKQIARLLLWAAAAFALSLTLRTIDMAVCATLPLGTHFMWHVLNALVLYLLLRAAALRPGIVAAPEAQPR